MGHPSGETTTLESSWKTIQSHGTGQTGTRMLEKPTTASISTLMKWIQAHGKNGNVLDTIEDVLVPMILLPSFI